MCSCRLLLVLELLGGWVLLFFIVEKVCEICVWCIVWLLGRMGVSELMELLIVFIIWLLVLMMVIFMFWLCWCERQVICLELFMLESFWVMLCVCEIRFDSEEFSVLWFRFRFDFSVVFMCMLNQDLMECDMNCIDIRQIIVFGMMFIRVNISISCVSSLELNLLCWQCLQSWFSSSSIRFSSEMVVRLLRNSSYGQCCLKRVEFLEVDVSRNSRILMMFLLIISRQCKVWFIWVCS